MWNLFKVDENGCKHNVDFKNCKEKSNTVLNVFTLFLNMFIKT